ncbi:response regulator transcription factor [soil metagenome]
MGMTTMTSTPQTASGLAATRVLVVEDDPTVAEVVARYLRRDGHEVTVVGDGRLALARAAGIAYDLVVLDIMLPGLDGLSVCRRLRERGDIPIIILSARGDETDKLIGLDLGADDYVAKPFSPRELAARVRTVLRRAQPPLPPPEDQEPVTLGTITLDSRARAVSVNGVPVSLTVREFDLLDFLMRHPSEVFRREALLERVWGYTFGDTSTVTVHVRRLREKVEADPAVPCHIQTVWGVGYRFAP